MKYTRRTAGYTGTDYKTNTQIAKELKITQILDKLQQYKRKWIQDVNRMPRNRLPRVMKHYSPTGIRSHGRPLKRILFRWDRKWSTSGPIPRQIRDDDVKRPFTGVRKIAKSDYECSHIYPTVFRNSINSAHEKIQPPLGEYSWNLKLEDLLKISHGNLGVIKIRR